MFGEFDRNNSVTSIMREYFSKYDSLVDENSLSNASLDQLFRTYSGCSINDGLIRFHTLGSSYIWTRYVTTFFRNYEGVVHCFAFDWMGRQFAISKDGNIIYMFDPATGEVNELRASLEVFLNEDLVLYRNDTLNNDFFENRINLYGKELEFDKCFGFKVLLFLGGKDELSNYEIIDIEVYWEMNYQVYTQINKLPSGKLINTVKIG